MEKYALLHPLLQKVYTEAKASYIEDHPGDVFLPTLDATFRSPEVQDAYYAQGRETVQATNALRKKAGLGPISVEENKRRITNAKRFQSAHNYNPARALDVVFSKDGKATWDAKLYAEFGQYMKVAAKKLGIAISYGGDWKSFPDFPHTELLNWKKI